MVQQMYDDANTVAERGKRLIKNLAHGKIHILREILITHGVLILYVEHDEGKAMHRVHFEPAILGAKGFNAITGVEVSDE